jgi:hypothetical protein
VVQGQARQPLQAEALQLLTAAAAAAAEQLEELPQTVEVTVQTQELRLVVRQDVAVAVAAQTRERVVQVEAELSI